MYRAFLVAVIWSIALVSSDAQDKVVWGSLSGKIVDENGKPVSGAIVFLSATKRSLPVQTEVKPITEITVKIPPGRSFDTLMHPYFVESLKELKVDIVGDKEQDHILRWHYKQLELDKSGVKAFANWIQADKLKTRDFFRAYVTAGDKVTVKDKVPAGPEQAVTYSLQSETYHELKTTLLLFSHPYFAVTGKDGAFSMDRIPAGIEVFVHCWQIEGGVLVPMRQQKSFKEGKNTLDIKAKTETDK